MKKLLCATALSCILSLSAVQASAHMKDSKESALIKASYALPKEEGDEFRQTMHESDEENTQLEQQIAGDHADLYDLLTAQDFDKSAFLKKSMDLRQLQAQSKENRDEAFASAVTELTPKSRLTLAHALESKAMEHKKAMHHHKHMAAATTDSNGPDQNARSGNTPDDKAQH